MSSTVILLSQYFPEVLLFDVIIMIANNRLYINDVINVMPLCVEPKIAPFHNSRNILNTCVSCNINYFKGGSNFLSLTSLRKSVIARILSVALNKKFLTHPVVNRSARAFCFIHVFITNNGRITDKRVFVKSTGKDEFATE